jgi:zinc protease
MPLRPGTHSRFLLLILLAASPLQAQPAGTERLTADPAVKLGTLENGVRYFLRVNKRPEKRAELRLVVNAGSVLEDADQRGLAHFVEHMAFNGTENFAKQQLVSYLESIGMRFGADLNAYTSFDETVYTLTVPTDTGKALETGIGILEEWAHRVTFDAAEIEKERGVVIEEWRLGRGAQSRLQDKSFPVLFQGSRYAERLPIGDRQILETFSRDALVRFYREWYRPDLMAVIAVGDFDAAVVERMIRERFSRIPARTGARARTAHPVPDHAETLVSVESDREAPTTFFQVFIKQPVRERGTVAEYRRSLVESLYNQMLNTRLAELAQKPSPPFLGAFSTQGKIVRTKEAYIVGAGVPDSGVMRGLNATLTEIERVQRHGFTASELERASADLLRGYEQAYAERDNEESSAFAAEYVRAFTDEEPIPGIAREFELVKQMLPGISLAETNALAREWITDGNRVIMVQGPERAGLTLPSQQELLAAFAAVKAQDIAAYQDVVSNAPLVRNPPNPGQLAAETRLEGVDVFDWRLSNGVRVLLKPTDFKADEVLLFGWSPGGLSLAPENAYLSAALSTTAVSFGGVGEFGLLDLQKVLAGNTAQVSPFIDELEEDVQGGSSPRDLETMLQLVYLYVTAPRTDSAAFASIKTRLAANLANRDANPETAFMDTLTATMSQHHPRSRPVTAARLAEWDLGTSMAFYRERFADAGDFTFVMVGAFQPEQVKPLILKWLGGLPSSGRKEAWKDVGIRPPTGVVEKVVRKGIEAKSRTQIIFSGPFEYTRENRYALASLRDVLDMRLRDVLREDLGGTYGVSVSQSTGREPYQRYTFRIDFGAAPDRLNALADEVFKQIARLQTEDVDAETLAKVKETQRRSYETSLRENTFWLSQIAAAIRAGVDMRGLLEYPRLVEGLAPAALRTAATRYLRRENYVRVSLFPESSGGSLEGLVPGR